MEVYVIILQAFLCHSFWNDFITYLVSFRGSDYMKIIVYMEWIGRLWIIIIIYVVTVF